MTTVLTPGRLTVDSDTTALRAAVTRATAAPGAYIILNLENVSRLDCSGIGELVRFHCAVKASGGLLTLVNIPPRHERMLEMAGLLRLLTVCQHRTPPDSSVAAVLV